MGDMAYVTTESHLARLERFAKRLYNENRMTGEEMRDMAHGIMGVVNAARAWRDETHDDPMNTG